MTSHAVPASALDTPAIAARSPLHVVYFNYEWDLRESSGAGTHIAEMTAGLRGLGHRVTAVNRRQRPPENAGDGPGEGARSWRSALSPLLHETAAIARAVRGIDAETAILARERPDVVLTRYSLHQFSSVIAARRRRIPLVFELNAPVGFEYRRYLSQYRLLPGLAEASEIRTLAAANRIFVVSNALRAHLVERGLPGERIAVVPNGADTERFRPDVVDTALRARLGQHVVVGFVGSFASFHGVGTLRNLIMATAANDSRVAFLLVGGGPLAEELRSACAAAGLGDRTVFTGFVARDRVPALLGAMDVVLAPYEPHDFFYFSPIKIFEYMAAGRSVVAARLGQIAEIIRDGENGLLYDPRVDGSLADRVRTLIGDHALRARLGNAARRTIEDGYTWRHNVERVETVLADAVAEQRS